MVVLLQTMASGGDVASMCLLRVESGECGLVGLKLNLYTQK
jgi:hypothetical protein